MDGEDTGSSGENRTLMKRPYLLEQVDDAAEVQYYADGFAALPLDQKILAWHLYQAALAGRDIYYDQRYAHNLELRDLLEEDDEPDACVISHVKSSAQVKVLASAE